VIIDDLDVVRVISEPAEADAPLIVDTYAVLASPVPCEFLKAVCGRDAEVDEAGRGIKHDEFAKGNSARRGSSRSRLANVLAFRCGRQSEPQASDRPVCNALLDRRAIGTLTAPRRKQYPPSAKR